MDTLVDSGRLLEWSARLCGAGVLVQSLELLWQRRELQDDGLFGWEVSRRPSASPLVRFVRWLHRYPGCGAVLAGRAVVAASVLVLPDASRLLAPLVGLLGLAQLYYNRRFAMVGSASDTMQLMVLTAVVAGRLPGATPVLEAAALGFLAFQVLLAYVATGWDKLIAPAWRSGAQVPRVFLYSLDRCRPLGEWFARHPRSAWVVAWSVILLELLFPICLLLPGPGFWMFVVAGLALHATVAVAMGLHSFWWSFVATYPALYFVHGWIAARLYG